MILTNSDRRLTDTTRAIIETEDIADILRLIGRPEHIGTDCDYAFAFGDMRSRVRTILGRLDAAEKRIAELEQQNAILDGYAASQAGLT